MVYFKKKSKQTNFLNTSLKENSPFWDSQLTVGEVLVLKKFKKLFSAVMAHMVLRQLRQEAQKFEASQDCRFLKQVSVFKSKKGGSGGEVRKQQEVLAFGRYR